MNRTRRCLLLSRLACLLCCCNVLAMAGTPELSLSLGQLNVTENDTANPAQFSIVRSGSVAQSLVVRFTVDAASTAALGPTAGVGVDLIAPRLSATRIAVIPVGAASYEITITPQSDNRIEPLEFVRLALAPDANYTIAPGNSGSFDINVADDPARVSISMPDPVVAEAGPDTGVVRLDRSGGDLGNELQVILSFSGQALQGTSASADYTLDNNPSSLYTIPAGEALRDLILVPFSDNLVEGDESLVVTVVPNSNPNSAYLIDAAETSTTIIDDAPRVGIAAIDDQASEAGDPGVFQVARTAGNPDSELFVFFSVEGSASPSGPGRDYLLDPNLLIGPQPPRLRFAPGITSKLVTVNPINDGDPNEPAFEDVILTIRGDIGQYLIVPGNETASVDIANLIDAVFEDGFEAMD
ncbi:MAG: hypothetical protein R3F15_13655 [Lysobacterales bacterium]